MQGGPCRDSFARIASFPDYDSERGRTIAYGTSFTHSPGSGRRHGRRTWTICVEVFEVTQPFDRLFNNIRKWLWRENIFCLVV